MVEKRTESRGDCDRGRFDRWVCGDESVELAGAGGLRTTHDHVLAGPRHPDLEQALVRRISRPARLRGTLETPDEGPLGADDSRGTRTVPPRCPQPL